MNGVTPKSKKESPKTPGGIRKSLLTPCRRVGLSRKWRTSACSSFISPLSARTPDTPERTEIREEKKRKKCDDNEHNTQRTSEPTKQLDEFPASNVCSPTSSNKNEHKNITLTPRNAEIPRKKSKVLSLSLKTSQETDKDDLPSEILLEPDILLKEDSCIGNEINSVKHKTLNTSKELNNAEVDLAKVKPIRSSSKENVTKLVRTESRSKKLSLKKSFPKSECIDPTKVQYETNNVNTNPKEKSPNNLTKECIVVIQKKIFKTDPHTTSNETVKIMHSSDSEPDIPLSTIKQESVVNVTLNTLDDNDFISKPVKKKRNLSMIKKKNPTYSTDSYSSQSSQEDTEKRTILIKKSYDKVTKPQKAKSTGSITQKDVDDLKARIEMKKKHLLAKAMSVDTEELRGLIKKWQKGCQDALMELLDLMKKKLPDRQNMDYADMLEALKIPAQLVGYDSENDCFITPDDNNVLLSAFKL